MADCRHVSRRADSGKFSGNLFCRLFSVGEMVAVCFGKREQTNESKTEGIISKMYNNMKIQTLLGAVLMAGCLASCSVEEQEIPASEQYAREYYKTFGVNGPSEGFNVVEQKSVHVNSTKPAHVQIFALQSGEYRLAADYQNVTNQTITFDGVKGDNSPFLVRCDGAMLSAENGGTVNYKGQGNSNSMLRSSAINPSQSSIVSLNTNYTTITCASGDETFKDLSEGNGQNNPGKFTIPDLQYVPVKANSSFTIYPAYWNSKKKHTVGIYFYDENGINTIPLYTDHDGDELQFKPENGTEYVTTVKDAEDCFDLGDAGKAKYTSGFSFQAKGYTLKSDRTVVAGLYVQIGEKYYFSDKDLNDGSVAYFAYKTINATSGSNGYTYYMFDDPSDEGGAGDRDFNDLVLYIGQELTPTSLESMGWTVACEDLGGTYDFDFNDIVFQVYYVSGNDWISIIPLAAGGTLPAYLQIMYDTKWYDISQEWHAHFGAKSDTYNSGQMINTCYGGADYERKIYPIKTKIDGTTFSMDPYATTSGRVGYLRVRVQRDKEWTSINVPGQNEDPQVLILPLEWRWPKELVRINSIYTKFGVWGENYSGGSENKWVNKISDEGSLTEDKFYKHVTSRGKAYEPTF